MDGSRLISSVSGGKLSASTDYGHTWNTIETGPSATGSNSFVVASSADGSRLVAAERGGVIHSSDNFGVTWNTFGTAATWASVALSSDGSQLAAFSDYDAGHVYADNSTTVTALTAGDCTITANQGGDVNHNAATGVQRTLTFTPAAPSITGISPSSGSSSGGTAVAITGTAFSGVNSVNFGVNPATIFIFNSDTQISATSPAGVAGYTADVTVTTPGGTSSISSADHFAYIQDQAKNQTTGTNFPTLAGAITAASTSQVQEIRAFDSQFDYAFILDKGITLLGGYDSTFTLKGSNSTTLYGSLTVTAGNSIADDIIVKGKLTVKGGSLKVKGDKGLKAR
jgi:hypothetical protein